MKSSIRIAAIFFSVCVWASTAGAELPQAETLLADLGLSASEIAEVKAGHIVTRSVPAAHERDLATSFAFFAPMSPADLVKQLRAGLLTNVDTNTLSHGTMSGAGSLADFSALALKPDGEKRARRYTSADADLNLSADEQAAFGKLGATAPVADVEAQLRAQLLARYQAYHAKGLAGIAPYARKGGAARAAGDDLRVALGSVKTLKKYAPSANASVSNIRFTRFSARSDISRNRWLLSTRSVTPAGSMRLRMAGTSRLAGVEKALSIRKRTACACFAFGTGLKTSVPRPAW